MTLSSDARGTSEALANQADQAVLAAVVAVPGHRRRWRSRVLLGVVMLALAWIDVVFLGPYFTTAVRALGRPVPGWLFTALAAQFVAMGTFARMQRRLLAAGGTRMSMPQMLTLTYAANALNETLPAGLALASGYTFRRLRAHGASVSTASFTILASGLLSTLSFAVVALVAWALAGAGSSGVGTLAVASAAVGGAVVLLRWAQRHPLILMRCACRALRVADRVMHRQAGSSLTRVNALVGELSAIHARPRDWITALGFAAANWVTDLLCLFACLQAVGASATTVTAAGAAFIAGKASASMSLLPGGLGVSDLAMIATLSHAHLGTTAAATAGVLLYRLVSFVLIVAVGWLLFTGSWYADAHHHKHARQMPTP